MPAIPRKKGTAADFSKSKSPFIPSHISMKWSTSCGGDRIITERLAANILKANPLFFRSFLLLSSARAAVSEKQRRRMFNMKELTGEDLFPASQQRYCLMKHP